MRASRSGLNETKAVVENMTGTFASGMFDLRGEISLADMARPQSEFVFTGRNLLLANDPSLRLLAHADLKAGRAMGSGGTISAGRFIWWTGQIYRRLEVTPGGGRAGRRMQEVFSRPRALTALRPRLLRVEAGYFRSKARPLAIGGNVALGQIIPDLPSRSAPWRNPVPVGRVEIKNTRAFLPYTILNDSRWRS